MKAIKLHKARHPFLGAGSYLIPVGRDWNATWTQVNHWVRAFEYAARGTKLPQAGRINWVTLVRIPNGHPIFAAADYIDTILLGAAEGDVHSSPEAIATVFRQLDRVERWDDREEKLIRGVWKIPKGAKPTRVSFDLAAVLPEIVLGAPIGRKQVLWTKDLRKLRKS